MNKIFFLLCCMVVMASLLIGCGETFNGAVKDSKRIGSGIKTVFIRE